MTYSIWGPMMSHISAQSARMSFGAHRLAVGIVIELDEFRSPPNEHRVARGENEPHRNPKTLRPCFRRAERRFRPVVFSRESAHLAAASQEVVYCLLFPHMRSFSLRTLLAKPIATFRNTMSPKGIAVSRQKIEMEILRASSVAPSTLSQGQLRARC